MQIAAWVQSVTGRLAPGWEAQIHWEWRRRRREAGRLLTEAGVSLSLPEACSLPLPQCCRQTRGS